MLKFDVKTWFGLTAMAAVALGTSAALPANAPPAPARAGADTDARCRALAEPGRPDLIIKEVRLVPAGPAAMPPGPPGAGPAPSLPEHCLVRAVMNPRVGHGGREFGIGFELRLPTDWNARFLFQGGGGLDGQVMPALGAVASSAKPPALTRGFAVVSTDAGHSGSMVDASFGLDQQARVDYAYNALDKVTLEARNLIGRYYGQPPNFSYMLGCSNGGRQALMLSQRMPLHFDGIVAGDPSIGFSRLAIGEVWNHQVVARTAPRDEQGRPIFSRAFSQADLSLVRTAVLARCDAKDNLADGMINDWQRCDFDPRGLACRAEKTPSCLSQDQVQALRDLHEGPRRRDGTLIYGSFPYDTGIASSAWRGMKLGTSETATPNSADATLGLGQFRYYQLTPPDPDFDPLVPFDYDEILERVRHTAAIGDADSPFLQTFVQHGKMIVYNGLSDQGMASGVLVQWYEQMLAATGEPARDSVRLFMVPGMLHCGGGEATDQFEMLDAIMDWVEKDEAPERILATSKAMPGISRPLCPYPRVARYRGGDAASALSFDCVE